MRVGKRPLQREGNFHRDWGEDLPVNHPRERLRGRGEGEIPPKMGFLARGFLFPKKGESRGMDLPRQESLVKGKISRK